MNNKEIEIKFGVIGEPENLLEILSSIGKVSGEKTDNLSNTYFDTDSRAMYEVRAGLRIRRANDYCEQTLKIRSENIGGIHKRSEYNVNINSDTAVPELAKFPKEAFPKDFNIEETQKNLKPVCQINFTRHSFDLEIMNGVFEVAFDHGGIILNDGGIAPINELEVELKKTDRNEDDVMFIFSTLATIFAENHLPLVMEPFSKMHRASILIQNKRNSLDFSEMHKGCELNGYILDLIKSFEGLYGLFLVNRDPLIFTYLNSNLSTLIMALKQLRRSGIAAFNDDSREPVSYKGDLKIIIKSLKGFFEKSSLVEKKITKYALKGDDEKLNRAVEKLRYYEMEHQIFLIPLKLRVLMRMLVN